MGHAYPMGSDSCIIGLCTGQLASAAVSSSRTVGELVPVAVQTVVLALRLGSTVIKVRDLVESNGPSPSWSVLVSGIREPEAQQLIQGFAQTHVSIFATSSTLEKREKRMLILKRLCLACLSRISVRSAKVV